MTVAAVRIPALHRMVDVTGGKRHVGDQQLKGGKECLVEVVAMRALLHAVEVPLELRRVLDRPQAEAAL